MSYSRERKKQGGHYSIKQVLLFQLRRIRIGKMEGLSGRVRYYTTSYMSK